MYRPFWNHYRTFDDASPGTAPRLSRAGWVAVGILLAIYTLAVVALFWGVS